MKITWDAEAKAMYIELPCELERKSAKTIQVHGYDQIYLDYNKAHELIGIEILNVDSQPVIEDITYRGKVLHDPTELDPYRD